MTADRSHDERDPPGCLEVDQFRLDLIHDARGGSRARMVAMVLFDARSPTIIDFTLTDRSGRALVAD